MFYAQRYVRTDKGSVVVISAKSRKSQYHAERNLLRKLGK